MTVKCLFGQPDSEACVKIAEQVLGAAKKEFEAKWNLSIVSESEDPTPAFTAATAAALPCSGSKSSESSWAWEEVAACHHGSSEVESRVPLLYVPNADNCEPGFVQRHGHLIVAMDSDDAVPDFSHDAATAAALLLESLSPRRKASSPRVTASLYSVHKSAFKFSKQGKNRLVSSSGFGDKDDKLTSMKQRCITDYLKVKKVPGQLNAIKTMQ